MKLIELLNCMEKGCRIRIHCPQVNGQYRVFGGTKDEMCALKEELVWAGSVAVVRAAKENLLEVWTR